MQVLVLKLGEHKSARVPSTSFRKFQTVPTPTKNLPRQQHKKGPKGAPNSNRPQFLQHQGLLLRASSKPPEAHARRSQGPGFEGQPQHANKKCIASCNIRPRVCRLRNILVFGARCLRSKVQGDDSASKCQMCSPRPWQVPFAIP